MYIEWEGKNTMDKLNELLKELGISKVNLAKFLGVSRQLIGIIKLEPRTFLNKKNIDEYNNAFNNTLDMVNNIYSFDTTNESIRDTSIAILNKILADMRVKYLDELNKEW